MKATNNMRALIIREPWIGLILRGDKTWELRSRSTNVRGRIALIRSQSGLIVGTANVVDCIPVSTATLRKNAKKHRVPMDRVRDYGSTLYAWVLKDSKPLRKPVRYLHPQGAVIWVTVPAVAA